MTSIDPKATPLHLEALACDPDNWHLLDEIAAHPNAWPELRAWADVAQCHPDDAGPPPSAPETPKRTVLERIRGLFGHLRGGRTRKPHVEAASARDARAATPPVPVPLPPSSINLGPTDKDCKAEGTRPMGRIARPSGRVVAIAAVSAIGLAGAAGAGYTLTRGAPDLQSERTGAAVSAPNKAEEVKEITRQRNAIEAASALLEEIDGSPVSDELDRSRLEQAWKDKDVPLMETETAALRQQYDETVATKSTAVGASIAGLIAQAESLSQAPESVERGELLELAGAWRGVEVTAVNLADAVQAEARLSELAGTVAAQQEQAAEAERALIAQEEAARNQPRQATPSPVAPQSQPRGSSPSAPQWSVPGATGGSGLPGRDGSL